MIDVDKEFVVALAAFTVACIDAIGQLLGEIHPHAMRSAPRDVRSSKEFGTVSMRSLRPPFRAGKRRRRLQQTVGSHDAYLAVMTAN